MENCFIKMELYVKHAIIRRLCNVFFKQHVGEIQSELLEIKMGRKLNLIPHHDLIGTLHSMKSGFSYLWQLHWAWLFSIFSAWFSKDVVNENMVTIQILLWLHFLQPCRLKDVSLEEHIGQCELWMIRVGISMSSAQALGWALPYTWVQRWLELAKGSPAPNGSIFF